MNIDVFVIYLKNDMVSNGYLDEERVKSEVDRLNKNDNGRVYRYEKVDWNTFNKF